ncbi:hypothetical protein LJC23_03315 [Desulfovibrio sp. OttesenSCG-928-I05]|nr:hypothetical protein [Desulfovibrio sp. OttesenSCG-928-I05]
MKRASLLVLALTLTLFAGACGDSDTVLTKLNGAWAIDLNATIENNPEMKKSIPDGEAGNMARSMLEGMLGSMELTFDTKAGTVSGSFGGQSFEAQKYGEAKVNGDNVELTVNGESSTITVKDNEMRMKSGAGIVVFTRK